MANGGQHLCRRTPVWEEAGEPALTDIALRRFAPNFNSFATVDAPAFRARLRLHRAGNPRGGWIVIARAGARVLAVRAVVKADRPSAAVDVAAIDMMPVDPGIAPGARRCRFRAWIKRNSSNSRLIAAIEAGKRRRSGQHARQQDRPQRTDYCWLCQCAATSAAPACQTSWYDVIFANASSRYLIRCAWPSSHGWIASVITVPAGWASACR